MTAVGALSPALAILGAVLTAALVACSPSGSGTVARTVTTEDGSPPSGCSVSAVPGDDVDQPVPEYAAVPDGRGRYEYRLPVGSYEVVATCETGSGSATVRIASGRTTAADLVVG